MLRPSLPHLVLGGFLLLLAGSARSQNISTAPCASSDGGGWFSQAQACEIRRTVLPVRDDQFAVNGKNGSIEVVGEDRRDIALEATVKASAPSRSEAENLLHHIELITSGTIHGEGPNQGGFSSRNWSISFKLRVPRQVHLTDLHTSNGSITAANLQGALNAESTNGSIHVQHIGGDVRVSSTNGPLQLQDLAAAVHAETTNGGVQVSLGGDRWQGSGLFAKSTNGGITLQAPDRFAAHLVAQTTNGGISVGFPIQLQGKIGHSIETNLNGGGAPVRLETTNGGISIDRL